jgi:hypothetical protein
MLSVALILYGSNSLSGFGTFSDFVMSYSVPLYVAVACQESAIRYRYIVGSASPLPQRFFVIFIFCCICYLRSQFLVRNIQMPQTLYFIYSHFIFTFS